MKKDKIGILIPTRERLNDFLMFADSWVETTNGLSDVIVGFDLDDDTYDNIINKYPFIWERGVRKSFLGCLNDLAIKYSCEYKYIGFMEDDCIFISYNWEKIFIDKIQEIGKNAIVWGNDLINGETIVGLPFMNSSIIERLGFMSPPVFTCLWVDHYWKQLAISLNSGCYFSDIIIEHRHYTTGKREKDQISISVDNVGLQDMYAYNTYLHTSFILDIQKLSLIH